MDDGKGNFRVAEDFTHESRKKALRKVRGDDKSFASESRNFSPPVNGTDPIASAARSGSKMVIKDPSWAVKGGFFRTSLARSLASRRFTLCLSTAACSSAEPPALRKSSYKSTLG